MGLDGDMYALWNDLARADGTPDGVEGDVDGVHDVGGGMSGKGRRDLLARFIAHLSLPAPADIYFIIYFALKFLSCMFQRPDLRSRFWLPIRHPRLIGRIDTDPIPSLLPGQ